MNKTRLYTFVGALIILGLVTGCYRSATDPVTPTPAGGAQAVGPAEAGATPDVLATAAANSAILTQDAQTAEAAPVEAATTQPAPTATAPPATEHPSPESATPEPTEPAVQESPQPTSPPSAGQITHVVQRGENLFRIALKYGTTVQAIASANGIANPALIYVGQKLVITHQGTQPPSPSGGGTTYTVQRGDNLFRIALKYNMSYLYLAQYNGIANPSNIYVGQVLRIPSQ